MLKVLQLKNKPKIAFLAPIPLVVLAVFGVISLINNNLSNAVKATDFNAGRIIDDEIFYNKDAMNAQQIQDFLNKQIGSCDTWGTQRATDWGRGDITRAQFAKQAWGIDPPFVCLNNYHENPDTKETSYEKGGGAFAGGISAAQIIYDASQKYGINPQVLLVMLKKESSGPLTNDTWPLKNQYRYAMGYACPDSGANFSAACEGSKGGFYNQMTLAAWQFKYYKENYQNGQYGKTLGWNNIQYSPNPACGTKRVNIENVATLSLYIYTPYTPNDAALTNYPGTSSCGAYGNRNFFMFFNEWFGSTLYVYMPEACDSKVKNVTCVWRLYNKTNGAEFLTVNIAERDTAAKSGDWSYNGMAFYAYSSQVTGSIPVYRVNIGSEHFFTSNLGERNSLIAAGHSDEGIAFYALPKETSTNAAYPVYRFNGKGGHFLNLNSEEFSSYQKEGVDFSTPSGLAETTLPEIGKVNVYRMNGTEHFLTTSLSERDALIKTGWSYEGVTLQTPASPTSTPVYRLNGPEHFYTTSLLERNSLLKDSKWRDEGIAFYVDSSTPRVFRFLKNNGQHFFTPNLNEAVTISNKSAYFEGIAFGHHDLDRAQVYRLNGPEHFYTMNVNELLKIVNSGWNYQGVAFEAYKTASDDRIPVYRLNGPEHFYTTSLLEKNLALKDRRWRDEGIAFYVPKNGTIPVYRLNGPEHFYTTSLLEKNLALKDRRWFDEGIAWYLD